MGLCGLGFGFFQAPNNRTMLAAAPRLRAGAAGGMLATARLTGQTIGATLAALVFRLVPNGAEAVDLTVGVGFALAASVASFPEADSVLRVAHSAAVRPDSSGWPPDRSPGSADPR